MWDTIRKVFLLFDKRERRIALLLLPLILLQAGLEVFAIGAVAPLALLLLKPDIMMRRRHFQWLYHALHFSSLQHFMLFLSMAALGVLVLGNAYSSFMTFITLRFSNGRIFSISKRLLTRYLAQPYLFFVDRNSSALKKNIVNDVHEAVFFVITPAIKIFSRGMIIISILILLLLVKPFLALLMVLLAAIFYFTILQFSRRILTEMSRVSTEAREIQHKVIYEVLGAIKDVKVSACEPFFVTQYLVPTRQYARSAAAFRTVSQIPRYLLEVVVFGSVILAVFYLLMQHENSSMMFSILSLYAFAGYRMMPSLQALLTNVMLVRGHQGIIDTLYNEFYTKTQVPPPSISQASCRALKPLPFNHHLRLDGISFEYPTAEHCTIKNVALDIAPGGKIAFVGPTGCGKTTILDLILGLLQPSLGNILVDNHILNDENMARWQRNLSYVPQNIFLIDDTLTRNIAFGVHDSKIDLARVKMVSKIAEVDEFVSRDLPHGYETMIGEQGVRLSGGQRQRIGIARALYRNAKVLILDEAMSALDVETEVRVMRAIQSEFVNKTVILVTHRLASVENCDEIFVLDQGELVERGTYQELMQAGNVFARMVAASTAN